MTDPVLSFIRAERDALHSRSPAPHAAWVWHDARRLRAARLGHVTSAFGWLVRFVLAGMTVVTFLIWRSEAPFLLFLFCLSSWLTRGACAPVSPNILGR